MNERAVLTRAYRDMSTAVRAARKLFPNAPDAIRRESAADFLTHVRELRRAGAQPAPAAPAAEAPPACPVCQGPTQNHRATKRGNQPDYKCVNHQCDGAIWLDRKRRVPTASTR